MEVRLAESAGFCFGVRRAVDTVYEQLKTGARIYTYGPIVHNEEVVKELEALGVAVSGDEEELVKIAQQYAEAGENTVTGETADKESASDNTGTDADKALRPKVIIRAHGVPRRIRDLIENSGMECVDATCPFVKNIHRIVEQESAEGKHIIIVGDPVHPEVEGIVGWCNGPVTVIETAEEASKISILNNKKVCVVSQTTFNYNKFQTIVEILEQKGYNDKVVNTICNATEVRQRSARALAASADVMIVIGGKHSSNTRKLYDICCEECANTYFIQTLDDLHLELPRSVRLVGITAGASTPNKLIEEVQNYVRINF